MPYFPEPIAPILSSSVGSILYVAPSGTEAG